MPETMKFTDTLSGHGGWVTQVATNPQFAEMLISASRDKTLIMWNLNKDDQSSYGSPMKRLRGHSHFVSDVVVSSCGQFAVSASWDKTLRLWDLEKGVTTTRFVGHKHDVLSVAFSADNRQIISASRDKTLKLWNTLGESKWTQEGKDCHQEWAGLEIGTKNTHPSRFVANFFRDFGVAPPHGSRPSDSPPPPTTP